MKRLFVFAIVLVPAFVIGQCVYREVAQPRELRQLCAETRRGTTLRDALARAAANESLKARTGGAAGKNDGEWFDRQYLRVGEQLKRTKGLADDYSVIFAKPGIGYYACIIVHRGDVVQDAWFEDHGN